MNEQDYELVSAYLDGVLSDEERAALELRLVTDAELRREWAALRQTVALVRDLPQLKAPRSFALTREMAAMYRQPVTRRSRLAVLTAMMSAAAAVALIALGSILLLSNSGQPQAAQTVNSVALASTYTPQPTAITTETQETAPVYESLSVPTETIYGSVTGGESRLPGITGTAGATDEAFLRTMPLSSPTSPATDVAAQTFADTPALTLPATDVAAQMFADTPALTLPATDVAAQTFADTLTLTEAMPSPPGVQAFMSPNDDNTAEAEAEAAGAAHMDVPPSATSATAQFGETSVASETGMGDATETLDSQQEEAAPLAPLSAPTEHALTSVKQPDVGTVESAAQAENQAEDLMERAAPQDGRARSDFSRFGGPLVAAGVVFAVVAWVVYVRLR